jgi:hypothetical protein
LITTETCRDIKYVYCDLNNIIEVEDGFDCGIDVRRKFRILHNEKDINASLATASHVVMVEERSV